MSTLEDLERACKEAKDFAATRRCREALRVERDRARSVRGGARQLLSARLDQLEAGLEASDRLLVADFAVRIRSGSLRGSALRDALAVHAAARAADDAHFGDEPVDALVERLLEDDERFAARAAPGDELVHYAPSPTSVVLALHARGWFARGEVFCDVGSGIGRVTTLAALLGEGRVVGVELDAELVEHARRSSVRLGAEVEYRLGDARVAPIEDATRYFFFAPFVGAPLAAVLSRLEAVARSRPIRVGSWGPSTEGVSRAAFLRPDAVHGYGPFDLATFHSL